MKIKVNKKQGIAITAIIVVGCIVALLILLSGKHAGQDGEKVAAHQAAAHRDETKEHSEEENAQSDSHGHQQKHQHALQHKNDVSRVQQVVLNEAQIVAADIKLQKVQATTIRSLLVLPGEVQFNADRTAHVVPRLAGVVQSVAADLGQQVKKGQVMAVLSSAPLAEQRSTMLAAQKRLALAQRTYAREKTLWQEKISAAQDYWEAQHALQEAEIAAQSAEQKLLALGAPSQITGALNRYEIRAPFDGVVVEKHITLGEAVAEDASIFTLSDLSSVWVEVAVPAKDLNVVHVGEQALVRTTAFSSSASGTIAYVGALLGAQTRTATARVSLKNPEGSWRPGLFVNVEIVANETQVAIAVANEAIHNVEDQAVVFVRNAEGFVAQPVTTGRSDSSNTEIIKGLSAEATYASDGSFVIKSEIGKAGAEHSH
tara:strand:- start:380045 stop:381331 length:1287 start_codon:yes stop_codon:yes gene_type:complete